MPTTITLSGPPVGYCKEGGFAGESVSVCTKEFSSSEDGNEFVQRLEGITDCFGSLFGPGRVRPPRVETFLAVVRPSGETAVYVDDEVQQLATVRRTRRTEAKAGELIGVNDIADVCELQLLDGTGDPIEIPADCGVCLLLSHRWRKGLFYDYSVFGPHGRPRTDSLPVLFGHFLTRLIFQEMYSATDAQWDKLLEWEWFPFAALTHADRKALLSWAGQGRHPGPVLEEFCRRFAGELDGRVAGWRHHPDLNMRMPFLTAAKERYEVGDYISCITVLYTQIEGVMRSLFVEKEPAAKATQGTMVSTLVGNRSEGSVLLPSRFEQFLKRVYFRSFDHAAGHLPLSRHTVAHGVSKPADYTFVRATVAFLVIDQLFHYLSD